MLFMRSDVIPTPSELSVRFRARRKFIVLATPHEGEPSIPTTPTTQNPDLW
jgi:hypothetical protein